MCIRDRYLGTRQVDDAVFHIVESIPREANPIYGKRIFWFLKTKNWDECVNTRIDYYDNNGELIKDQFIKWQRVGNAWGWDRVLVRSRRTLSASIFQLSEIKINAAAPVMDKDGKKVVRPAFRKEALDDVLLLISREAITEEDGKYLNIDKALSDLAKAKPWLLDESAPASKGSPSESGRQLKKQDGTQERAPIIRSL